jgi:hypothetical protein
MSLSLLLASIAIVTAQVPVPPQPVFPPPCGTMTQIVVSIGSDPTTIVASQDTQNGVYILRTDSLSPPFPNGESTLTTSIFQPKQLAVITNSLNGTVSCVTTAQRSSPPPPFPPFAFVGVETNSGVKANHWRLVQGSSGPGQSQFDMWTEAADNDVPLNMEFSTNNVTQIRSTFTHFIKCARLPRSVAVCNPDRSFVPRVAAERRARRLHARGDDDGAVQLNKGHSTLFTEFGFFFFWIFFFFFVFVCFVGSHSSHQNSTKNVSSARLCCRLCCHRNRDCASSCSAAAGVPSAVRHVQSNHCACRFDDDRRRLLARHAKRR